MKPLLAIITVLSLCTMSGADTVKIKARYKCENGRCVLIKDNLPAVAQLLPVPEVREIPSQQPTPAAPQADIQPAAESKPMRSVLVKPVRGAFCAFSKVREAKPVRRLLGRLFCR